MMVDAISADDLDMLAETLRKTMTASCGQALDKSLVELGWLEMLEYGAAGGRVEIPLDVLFPPSTPGEH